MREISDRNILDEFCIQFCSIVEKHCKYIIVSGFVAISSGRTRATEDIDMIIERIDKDSYLKLHSDLIKAGFVCMQSDDVNEIYLTYLKAGIAVRYTWKDKPLPEMELKFSKDKLDDFQITNRVKLPLTGLDIWFSNIATNIAFKEELLKSDKDFKDAEHLRKIYSNLVNETEINDVKKLIRRYRL